jgi:acyl-CoA thioesterase I
VLIEENAVVLFQGDSITDCGRSYTNDTFLGNGYAAIAAARFSALHPERHVTFLNRGVGGARVVDLKARWQRDCLDLRPTWVSILIGINDARRHYERNAVTDLERYVAAYRDLLARTAATGARLILCEPFFLPFLVDQKELRADLDRRIQAVHDLAREFHAVLVPFDSLFADAMTRHEPGFWTSDGVHPTLDGHSLMADAWLRAVGAL